MNSLFRSVLHNNNFLSIFGNILSAGFAFLSFAILARSYLPTDFGQYMLFVVGGTFLEMLRFGLTRTSIVKFLLTASTKDRKALIGANYLISLVATLAINAIIAITYLAQQNEAETSGFYLFLKWYPVMALANLPLNNAISLMLAKERFASLLFVRFIPSIVFLAYAITNFFIFRYNIETTIIIQISTQLFSSIICVIFGWDGATRIRFVTRSALKQLISFGKFSVGTLISTSLIKSADTFILGLIPILGVDAVAIYSVPLKLSELLEIPLRSFAATLYPRMVKASKNIKNNILSGLYLDYSGMLFFLFIPLLLFCEIFAYPLVMLFGGEQYLESIPIFRVYILYGLFLPFDRLSGIALDAIEKPKHNLYKVVVMVALNIIGDIIAIVVFQSLFVMAAVTIINTFVGAYIGYSILNRYIEVHFSLIFIRGWKYILAKRSKIYELLQK